MSLLLLPVWNTLAPRKDKRGWELKDFHPLLAEEESRPLGEVPSAQAPSGEFRFRSFARSMGVEIENPNVPEDPLEDF